MDFGLQGKVALVLAASKGLGRASAATLAAEGASVVIGARNEQLLTQVAREIQQASGSRVIAVPVDVNSAEAIERIMSATISTFGRLDILVTNAGGPPLGKFEAFDDQVWLAAFEQNLLSVVRLIRSALPHLRASGSGRIVNIVSTSVKQPIEGLLLSNAIRPGVVGLAKTLSIELGPDNITVNNVCPGRILTDRLLGNPTVQQKLAQGIRPEEALSDQTKDIPLGRIGKPEELGALVAFLASQQGGYITGTTIQVDGGLTRAIF
jgi:3-oxoacyl-[acyl-carrier protein] reductase